jgi:hypothetical protein
MGSVEGNGRLKTMEDDIRGKASAIDLAARIKEVREDVNAVREDVGEVEVCLNQGLKETRDLIDARFIEQRNSRRKDLGLVISISVMVITAIGFSLPIVL